MSALKSWHQVAVPREDLRQGKPLDAAEFAIHLDQVVDGRAPLDYRDPQRFFARTYLTSAYRKMAVEVLRRLAGDIVGTSPGINLTTQFGGGKTHFLTLLYHLVRGGERARDWAGVASLLEEAQLEAVPSARVAVFIGNRFDFVVGSGADGEPKRKTPWGDIAWQLGGAELYRQVQQHDEQGIVPGGEVLQKVLGGQPTLILMDELLSFTRRTREAGGQYATMGSQMYSFLDVLTREAAGMEQVVLVISLPTSEYEMTSEDETTYQRLDKLLSRLFRPVLLSEHLEIAEIVRRRLFEHVGEPNEIRRTASEYARWVHAHRQQLPDWLPTDLEGMENLFASTYPFHPTVISVFERKWQSLPRFQRTRGILRLLALWVSDVYQRAFREGSGEPLITLGSAPLENSLFRAAVFEQLGEGRLEAAVLTDIAGNEAHAVRLDAEASDTIRRARLHRKVATSIFFESSGGQVRNEATLPEVRLAVGAPEIDIGNIETVLEALVSRCHYLDAKGTAYWLSHRANLNKVVADKRAALSGSAEAEEQVREKVRDTVRAVFRSGQGVNRYFFAESPADVPDVPALSLVVLAPEHGWENSAQQHTRQLIEGILQNAAGRARTFKSALLFAVAENGGRLTEQARTVLAYQSLEDPAELERYDLDDSQKRELREKRQRAERDLQEMVWRCYRHVLLLGEDNQLHELDLGITHSSMAESLVHLILSRLRQEGLLEDAISPDFLARHWPPALPEWSTKGVRDAFFASPLLPRLLDPEVLRSTIARGVREGKFGYTSRRGDSLSREDLRFEDTAFSEAEVEFSDDVVLIPRDRAMRLREEGETYQPFDDSETGGAKPTEIETDTGGEQPTEGSSAGSTVLPPTTGFRRVSWQGELPWNKWHQFYVNLLSLFSQDPSLRLSVRFDVAPQQGVPSHQLQQIRQALRELGLDVRQLRTEGDEDSASQGGLFEE